MQKIRVGSARKEDLIHKETPPNEESSFRYFKYRERGFSMPWIPCSIKCEKVRRTLAGFKEKGLKYEEISEHDYNRMMK